MVDLSGLQVAGILDGRECLGIRPWRRGIEGHRPLLTERLVGALVVEFVPKVIEALLLALEGRCRRRVVCSLRVRASESEGLRALSERIRVADAADRREVVLTIQGSGKLRPWISRFWVNFAVSKSSLRAAEFEIAGVSTVSTDVATGARSKVSLPFAYLMVRFVTQNYIGTKHMALARKKSSSKSPSASPKRVAARATKTATAQEPVSRPRASTSEHRFAICIRNDQYRASLELRKLYVVLDDSFAAKHQMIRVIDESGEDYLYPQTYFVCVDLPSAVERTLRKIA